MIRVVNRSDIPKKGGGRLLKYTSPLHTDVSEFIKSGADCCEVDVPEGKPAKRYYQALVGLVHRCPDYKSACRVAKRGDRVFIVKRSDE